MWRKMERSSTISQKQAQILEGLLKMNESMIPVVAQTSQRSRKRSSTRMRAMRTKSRRLFRERKNRSCPVDVLFMAVQLLPDDIEIVFELRGVPSAQRGVLFQRKGNGHDVGHPGGSRAQDDDAVRQADCL